MRGDMSKVIVERPRWGSRIRTERPQLRSPEEAPRCESMGGRSRRRTKQLNENLAPLWRFIRSRVGRPWDEVYSEIRARLSPSNAVQMHVLQHVRQMVEEHVVLVDGRPHGSAAWGGRYRPITGSRRWPALYVCPLTGRLAAPPIPRDPPKKTNPDLRPLDDGCEARRIDGVWYRFRFAPLPPARADRARLRDRLLGVALDASDLLPRLYRAYGRTDRFAVEKRQLSSRAIAALPR